MAVEVVDDLVVVVLFSVALVLFLVLLVVVVVRGVSGHIESQIDISMVHNTCF